MTSIYLGWVDDTPHKTVEEKIRDGATAYLALFHAPAEVCVCSTANAAAVGWTVDGIPVGSSVDKGAAIITTPNLFLLGRIETAEALGARP
jgi:hypothetical protein